MIKEAVESHSGISSNTEIIQYIEAKYGPINHNSIRCDITQCCVNSPSRIHYPMNQKPRIANTKYDFLFWLTQGKVELYDPEKHGNWEITKDDLGNFSVILSAQTKLKINLPDEEEVPEEEAQDFYLKMESHLRDFIAINLGNLKFNGKTLALYTDEFGKSGVEYQTGVGRIDLLAVDEEGQFTIFELKLSKGEDAALGQLQRYMGWVKVNLANGQIVQGIIIAKSISEKLKFAVLCAPEVSLLEYTMQFNVREISLDAQTTQGENVDEN